MSDLGSGRPYVRTAPVVLDHGRLGIALPAPAGRRAIGQALLVGLLAVAFIALLATRIGPLASAPVAATSPTPSPTAAPATPATSPTPSPTAAPATPDATASEAPTQTPTQTPAASVSPTAPPTATAAPATYRVRSGDTLGAIAARFGTTVRVLSELNGITDPGRIRVGQVLKLP